jgi:ribulose-phosphate 3-epimerase
MSVIVPCVTVSTAEEYKSSLERIHTFATRFHVDISDNTFAPVTLLAPEQIWWPQEWQVDIHVMVAQPSQYLQQLISLRPHMITIHAEITEDLIPLLQQIRAADIRAGVALMRATVPSDISGALEIADHAMIFSGDLGKYGGVASLMQLEKIRLIKAINAGIEIGWDGGITIENAFSLSQGGVDVLNCGGAIQKTADPMAAFNALTNEINKQGVI